MLLGQQVEVEVLEQQLEPGDMVEVRIGSMTGLKGELITCKGKEKLIIRIDHISHALLVTLPKGHVVKLL
jgi:hypothetical protein